MNIGKYLRDALLDEWDGIDRITRDVRIADLVTVLNAVTGTAAMVLAGFTQYKLAAMLVLLAILLDGVDGAVARLGGKWGGGPLGAKLDSLADGVSFVAAPAVITVSAFQFDPLAVIGAVIFVACGLLRLARFDSIKTATPTKYFSGMPSPGAALMVATIFLVNAPFWAAPAMLSFTGILMISRIRYPKLRGILGAIAATLMAIVLATNANQYATWAMAGFLTFFLFAGPFYVLGRFGPTKIGEPQ